MEILRLLLNQSEAGKTKLLFFSALAGITSVLLLAILNAAAEAAIQHDSKLILVASFILVVAISVLAQKFVWRVTAQTAEDIVHGIRSSILRKVAGCSLENLEKISRAEIVSALSQHAYGISISAPPIIVAIQSLTMLAFSIAYLAYLSILAFLVAAAAVVLLVLCALARSRTTNRYIDASIASEHKAYTALTELIDGFQETKLNQKREAGLVAAGEKLSAEARANRVATNQVVANGVISTQTSLYFLLAALVFVMPLFSMQDDPETVVKLVTVGLFIIGPITGLVATLPMFTHAEASLGAIRRIEALLDRNQESINPAQEPAPFETLALQEITFDYADTGGHGFNIGPLSFSVNANEVVFVTGGNGSGKTTMLRILLGLYTQKSGAVLVNGSPVTRDNLATHRALFATVLSDYHLFTQNYGLPPVDPERVKSLLQRMDLASKTGFGDGQFDTLGLSTGQRKRLALIVAILEDRPILVFDEWAADQDPGFRRIFYTEIIPELRAAGKTVIAVTHDEKYFDCCDRHLHMIEGRISEIKPTGT